MHPLRLEVPRSVHCRIGSLESHYGVTHGADGVHCRIGSLENQRTRKFAQWLVHCRIGSLEIHAQLIPNSPFVHCRIGSLENQRWSI